DGQTLWKQLSKAPLKKEEYTWTGIEEYLTGNPEARFTRGHVLEFLSENGVTIEEMVATTDPDAVSEIQWSGPEVIDNPDNWEHIAEDYRTAFSENESEFGNIDIDHW